MTLYPRWSEEISLSWIEIPNSLQVTVSELEMSAMWILWDWDYPSAVTLLSPEQIQRLRQQLGLETANGNRAPVDIAA